MKIIAISVPGPTPDPKKMGELAGEEARNAWELLKADVVREAYLRKDKPQRARQSPRTGPLKYDYVGRGSRSRRKDCA